MITRADHAPGCYWPDGHMGACPDPLPFSCCDHCGCHKDDRVGHDDTCERGCNDTEMQKVEGD